VNDHQLAALLAYEAGGLLMRVREQAVWEGLDEKALRARGDHDSNEYLLLRLAEERPDDAVLSEESKDDLGRLDSPRVWIVDPLDGTREYAEGRHDFAVHVALVWQHQPVAGAVSLPAEHRVFATEPRPHMAPAAERIRLVVSRSRPPKLASYLAEGLDAELVPLGSAGAKTMSVILGNSDVYAHAGGQYEWDSCAPVAVARAAGLHVSRLDGSPLHYNNADPYLPDLLVCRPELAARVLDAVASAPPGSFETAD
jgi:3'(2'), 5'-bisphosphate nucleotidase